MNPHIILITLLVIISCFLLIALILETGLRKSAEAVIKAQDDMIETLKQMETTRSEQVKLLEEQINIKSEPTDKEVTN